MKSMFFDISVDTAAKNEMFLYHHHSWKRDFTRAGFVMRLYCVVRRALKLRTDKCQIFFAVQQNLDVFVIGQRTVGT